MRNTSSLFSKNSFPSSPIQIICPMHLQTNGLTPPIPNHYTEPFISSISIPPIRLLRLQTNQILLLRTNQLLHAPSSETRTFASNLVPSSRLVHLSIPLLSSRLVILLVLFPHSVARPTYRFAHPPLVSTLHTAGPESSPVAVLESRLGPPLPMP